MIVMLTLFFRPQKTTTVINANTMQNAYNNGNGSLDVAVVTKPFAVTRFQSGVIYNAATFSTSGASIDSFVSRVVGNSFSVSQPFVITHVQIVADFLSRTGDNPQRDVVIYDLATSTPLLTAVVGLSDPVVENFYTHAVPFEDRVTLEVNRMYAIVSLITPRDFYARDNNIMQSAVGVQLHKRVDVPGSTLLLPTESQFVEENDENLQFASFQFLNTVVNQPGFQVDVRSQNATYPLNYVYNLNVQVESTNVQLEPGLCTSDAQNNNMINDTIGNLILSPDVVGVPNGLDIGSVEPEQWYAVHLITSTVQGKPPAAILSKNRQMPSLFPVGYESSKRVGWARTKLDANAFWPMVQQGNGARRLTIYKQPLPLLSVRTFTVYEMLNVVYVPLLLTLVSPTCSSAILTFVVSNFNDTPLNIFLRDFNATTDLVQVVANPSSDSQLSVEVPTNDFYLPYRLQMAVSANTFIANDVTIAIHVQSFFDDL